MAGMITGHFLRQNNVPLRCLCSNPTRYMAGETETKGLAWWVILDCREGRNRTLGVLPHCSAERFNVCA